MFLFAGWYPITRWKYYIARFRTNDRVEFTDRKFRWRDIVVDEYDDNDARKFAHGSKKDGSFEVQLCGDEFFVLGIDSRYLRGSRQRCKNVRACLEEQAKT